MKSPRGSSLLLCRPLLSNLLIRVRKEESELLRSNAALSDWWWWWGQQSSEIVGFNEWLIILLYYLLLYNRNSIYSWPFFTINLASFHLQKLENHESKRTMTCPNDWNGKLRSSSFGLWSIQNFRDDLKAGHLLVTRIWSNLQVWLDQVAET